MCDAHPIQLKIAMVTGSAQSTMDGMWHIFSLLIIIIQPQKYKQMSKMKSTFEFIGITKCKVWKNMSVRRQQAKKQENEKINEVEIF